MVNELDLINEWFYLLAQDGQIAVISKDAVAFLVGNLPGDVQFLRALLSVPKIASGLILLCPAFLK